MRFPGDVGTRWGIMAAAGCVPSAGRRLFHFGSMTTGDVKVESKKAGGTHRPAGRCKPLLLKAALGCTDSPSEAKPRRLS
jgi:hypothetical protein